MVERIQLSTKTLYVYIDESGNFDFSPTGTKHLVLSAVICPRPIESATRILNLKYKRLALGLNTPEFHASHDRYTTREQVLSEISRINSIGAYSTVIDKHALSRTMSNPGFIYQAFGLGLAAHIITNTKFKRVVLVFDKALKSKEEDALFSSLKKELASSGQLFHIYFQNVSKDPNAQIADYLAWTLFVSCERGNQTWISKLPKHLQKYSWLDLGT